MNFQAVPQTRRHADKLLLILWLCFIARGCFYSAMLPLWEGYDEPLHFAFIQHVLTYHALPTATTPVSREVEASLHLIPLSWEQRLHALPSPIYTEDSYWQLAKSERDDLQRQFRALPPAWGMEQAAAPANYEAQQAPLYYWIMALPLHLASGWALAGRVMLVRFLSVLIASLLVPIAWITAGEFFGGRAQAVGMVAVIVCMPELMINVSRVGNECLAVVIYSWLTLLLLRAASAESGEGFISGGVVLGIGLLTKAYFLLAVPAFVVVAAYCASRHPPVRKRIIRDAVIGVALALLISGGWYWRNHLLTGAWSGEQGNAEATRRGFMHLLAAAPHVHWVGGISSVLISHIWFGGWSFLKLPKPVYLIFMLGLALAFAGFLRGSTKQRLSSAPLVVVANLYGFFWLGLLYDTLLIYVTTGVSGCPGWYMYAVVLPEMLLVAYGLYQLFPKRSRWFILPAITTAFAAIDLYGLVALMLPYCTGEIRHAAGSDVVRGSVAPIMHTPATILWRLAANKPQSLREPVLALLASFYVGATLCLVGLSFVSLRSMRDDVGGTWSQSALSSTARV